MVMANNGDSIGYAGAFHTYYEPGWRSILPMRRGFKKWPPSIKCANKRERPPVPCLPGCECISYTGYDAVIPSWPDMMTWSEQYPDGNLCLHMPDGFIAIDVDAYGAKTGAAAIAEAVRRWGPLPTTPRSTSRGDGVSGIRIFRVPPGTALETRIAFPDLGIGDIEIIQRHHRYVIAWPSVHPEGGQYQWLDDDGQIVAPPGPNDVPALPQAWIDGLRVVPRSEIVIGERVDINTLLTPGDPSPSVQLRLTDAIKELNLPGQSRHDTACRHVLALMRMGKNGQPGVMGALRLLCDVLIAARRVDGSGSPDETRAEFQRMVYGERAAKELSQAGLTDWVSSMIFDEPAAPDQRPIESSPAPPTFEPTSQSPPTGEVGGDQGPTADTSGSVIVDDSAPRSHLEEIEQGFWQSRESLAAIYQTAMSRMASPWATLGMSAARALVHVRPHTTLPPIIGGRGSLNWFVALVALSSGGKGAAGQCSELLVPLDEALIRGAGSGEGILKAFAAPPSDDNPGGTHEALMFNVAEGDTLNALNGRSASTTLTTLRQGWSGETLGFSYAGAGKNKHLPAHSYRMTLAMGVQPLRSGWLIDDAAGGTPQRFMWFPAEDNRIPMEESWPAGPLTLPRPGEWLYPREIAIPAEARFLIRSERVKAMRGQRDALDGHALFCREKFAYALTVLDGRVEMTLEDWELSGIAALVSSYTRQLMIDAVQEAAIEDAVGRGELRGVEMEAADVTKLQQKIKRGERILNWLLHKIEAAPEGWLSQPKILEACSGRDREALKAILSVGHETIRGEFVDGTIRWYRK